ncbi:MAG: protein kinase [Actinoplanes sp.]
MSREIHGYRLTSEFTTAGGGQCRWAFGERNGREYFIKEFLAPTYPLPDSPGSAATKARKLARCRQFEQRHLNLMASLAGLSKTGGNLVVAHDFFRHGARYYKVTIKVDVSTIDIGLIPALPRRAQVILATTVAHSLQILHRLGLVHGDVKPPNVLLKRTAKGLYTSKLIDFDDAYESGRPPVPDELVGDIAYYSPEAQRYVLHEATATELTCAADIFALGILINEYLTGARPAFPGGLTGAAGVLAASAFTTGLESAWPAMDRLVRRMLAADAAARPDIAAVIAALRDIRDGGTGEFPAEPVEPPPPAGPAYLKGKLTEARPGAPYLQGSMHKKR